MKFVFVLVFLMSTLWATSHQRFHLQRSGQPWWSQYHQPQIILQHNQPKTPFYYDPVDENTRVFRYSKPKIQIRPTVIYSENDDEESNYQELFNRKQYDNDPNSRDDESKNLFLFEQLLDRQSENKRPGIIMPVIAQSSRYVMATNPNQMADVMPRIKNYGPVRDLSTKNQEQNARFFYFDGTNFLSKTVTISVTSTCTTLSIISCIPLASLDPNAPPVNCRRKRSVEIHQTDQEDTQFSVNPTKVQTVLPTVEPLLVFKSDSIQPPSTEMISSKEEETIDTGDSSLQIENQLRKGRVFKFNIQNFLTYTTSTILKSIITSTLTQTYLPAVKLACLPAGYSLCPV